MKKIFLLIFLVPVIGHAELKLERTISQKQASTFIAPMLETVVRPYGDQRTPSFQHGETKIKWAGTGVTMETPTQFAWNYNGNIFYSNIGDFMPDATPVPGCKEDMTLPGDAPVCNRVISGYSVCHLFMFDENRRLEAVQPLYIQRPGRLEGKPTCDDVIAIATASVIPDALLITIQYRDSNWRCLNARACAADIEVPELYPITLLVRFKQDGNGKLQLEQDDTCFGNPNHYKTIAEARQALKLSRCK